MKYLSATILALRSLAFLLLFVSIDANGQEFEPYSGLWWVPDEPGSGISIEFQDDINGATTAFVAIYSFDETGNAVWYVGNGDYTDAAIEIELSTAASGSCLDGCPPMTPEIQPSNKTLRVAFFSSSAAEMNFGDGETKQLRPFVFAAPLAASGENERYGTIAVPDLTGTWVFATLDGSYLQVFDIVCCIAIDPPNPFSVGMFVEPPDDSNTFALTCASSDQELVTPYCVLRDGFDQTVFSMFGGDIGVNSITGYLGEPVSAENGVLRGDHLVFGRRIQGDPNLR